MNILEIAEDTYYATEIRSLNSWNEFSTEIYFDHKESGTTFECSLYGEGFKQITGDNIEEKREENIFVKHFDLELIGVYDMEGANLDVDAPFWEISEVLKNNLTIENLI